MTPDVPATDPVSTPQDSTSNLTDAQWAHIALLLLEKKTRG